MSFQVKNFFAFLYKTIVDIIIYSLILATVLAILPNSLFKDFPLEPKSFEIKFPEKVENWNNVLDTKSQQLLKGVVVGPESLALKDDFIYTGLSDGRLIEISKKSLKIRDVSRFGNGILCEKVSDCGRLLGMKFHRDGHLYALDYYNGLFRINVSSGHKELVFTDKEVTGFDDLQFDPKLNVVYISVMTTKWGLDRVFYGLLDSDDTGFILAHNLDTKTTVKLRTGMTFPNGIQITNDKKNLLVAETLGCRILKISIQNIYNAINEKRLLSENEVEVFSSLPGEPDNVRLEPNGDVLVGMFSVRKNGKILSDYMSNWPFIRKAIGRTAYSFAVTIDFVNKLFGSQSLKTIASELHSGHSFAKYLPTTGAVIKLDAKSGQIKAILGSELYNGITEAVVDSEGDLYFGNFASSFLGRIKKGNH